MGLALTLSELQTIRHPRRDSTASQHGNSQLGPHPWRSAPVQQQLGVLIRIRGIQPLENLGRKTARIRRLGLSLVGESLASGVVRLTQAGDLDQLGTLQVASQTRVGCDHCPVVERLSSRCLTNGPMSFPTTLFVDDGQSEAARHEVFVQDREPRRLEGDLQNHLDRACIAVYREARLDRPDLRFFCRP